MHTAFQVLGLISRAVQRAYGNGAAVAARADGDEGFVVRDPVEAACELGEGQVEGAADMASAPFGGLAHVDHEHAAVSEPLGHRGRVDVRGSREETHRSDPGGALDHTGELAAHVGGDCRKLVVADNREHALGVDRGDVRLTVPRIDDDVAREQDAEVRFS